MPEPPASRTMTHSNAPFLLAWLCLLGVLSAAQGEGDEAPGARGAEQAELHFRETVLPILERSCFECHGPKRKRAKGGLRLDGRPALLRGGDSGPAVVPGSPDESLLVQAVLYEDELMEMPPDGKLAEHEIAALERWVGDGAPWPSELTTAPAVDAEARNFFEERIRPVLSANCFECHGPELDSVKGELRMRDSAALVAGGASGPALVPGDVEASRLIQAVRYEGQFQMPPDRMLPPEAIRDLERWVEMGAPWPSYGGAATAGEAEHAGIDVDAGREWWSFQPLQRRAAPAASDSDWVRSPIDAFVLAKLDEHDLEPSPEATKRQLIRRAYIDLIGLQPTFEEVEAFVADTRPDAWEQWIEKLLARPEYGERWGRHWLDLVRFAQTNGYERDTEKPYAWRYRDYVIRSFNEDVPYDRFLMEQLAGDELDEVTADSLIATGFYRVGPWDDEPPDPNQATYDVLDDVVRTIGEGMLGVTIGCARCHDHKFDPFPQSDYYRTLAFVRNVQPYTKPTYALDSAALRPVGVSGQDLLDWEAEREARLRELERQLEEAMAPHRQEYIEGVLSRQDESVQVAFAAAPRQPEQQALVDSVPQLNPSRKAILRRLPHEVKGPINDTYRAIGFVKESFRGSLDWALVVTENVVDPEPTHLLVRGRAATPGDVVEPGFVRALCETDEASVAPTPGFMPTAKSSGLRRTLAEWIASPSNPLTARVMANRVWQFHFGRGIVATPNDFGKMGLPPTHPELLDWLASELVSNGWSIKQLHRTIMGSAAYRMSSRSTQEAALERDPGNELLWRQNLRRLDAEVIRDNALAISGELNGERGGRGFFPRLSRGALARHARPGEGWEVSGDAEQMRRSVYAYAKRSMPIPFLEIFDAPTSALPTGARSSTTVASQSLTLLNSEFIGSRASAFAERIAREAATPEEQVTRAFELALARRPSAAEHAQALAYLERQSVAFAGLEPLLSFAPRVPDRLHQGLLAKLAGVDVMWGPRAGWLYLKGIWGGDYNATLGLTERGAAALLESPPFDDGIVDTQLRLGPTCESASLILHGQVDGDSFTGLELRFDAEKGAVELLLHGEDTRVLDSAPAALVRERWHRVRVKIVGKSLHLWIDNPETTAMLTRDRHIAGGGMFGVRAIGGTVDLQRLTVRTGETRAQIGVDDAGTPEHWARAALCLALLNLNELLYVD